MALVALRRVYDTRRHDSLRWELMDGCDGFRNLHDCLRALNDGFGHSGRALEKAWPLLTEHKRIDLRKHPENIRKYILTHDFIRKKLR